MCVFPCNQHLAAGKRLRQVTFHIPCRKTGHPAQHRHGRGEICTVSLLCLEQEHGNKIDILRMFTDIQGIPAVIPQPVLDSGGFLIRIADPCRDLLCQLIYRLLQVVRKRSIYIRNRFPTCIAFRGA